MIVIGTRGQGTVRRTFLGSVSDYVVHHAHCPVAVCSHPRKQRLTHTTSSEGYNDEPVTPTSPMRSPFAKQDKYLTSVIENYPNCFCDDGFCSEF